MQYIDPHAMEPLFILIICIWLILVIRGRQVFWTLSKSKEFTLFAKGVAIGLQLDLQVTNLWILSGNL